MSKKRGPGRPRKRGRPKKAPGEPVDHRLTPKIRIAILAIVEDNAPRAHAAKLAGLTDDAVRKAMKDNPAAREFYTNEVRALMQFAKAKAAHARRPERCGPRRGRAHDPGGQRAISGGQQHAAGPGLRDSYCRYPKSASAAGWACARSDRAPTGAERRARGTMNHPDGGIDPWTGGGCSRSAASL
jgi:hypothetical protein